MKFNNLYIIVMKNLLKYMKVGVVFAKGILGFRKKQYRLGFVHDTNDGIWYIDMPWPGDRHNLAMVAGSNKLLDYLCDEGKSYVTVDVLPRKKQEEHEGYFVCEQVEASLFGGSTYGVHGLEGFDREIWICPVTLCVLGYYPKYIYIRKQYTHDAICGIMKSDSTDEELLEDYLKEKYQM